RASDTRWNALLLLALSGFATIAIFLVLQVCTDGGFIFHVITANMNRIVFERVTRFLEGAWELMPFLMINGVLFVILSSWKRLESWWLFVPYFVGAVLSTLTIGKIGSDVNYFLELSAALSLGAGFAYSFLSEKITGQAVY